MRETRQFWSTIIELFEELLPQSLVGDREVIAENERRHMQVFVRIFCSLEHHVKHNFRVALVGVMRVVAPVLRLAVKFDVSGECKAIDRNASVQEVRAASVTVEITRVQDRNGRAIVQTKVLP